MTNGSETSTQAEPTKPPPEKPPAKKRSRWRWLRRIFGTGALLAVVAVVLLFAPGWPLAPLAPLANRFLETSELRVELEDLWLRAHTSGQLTFTAQRISAGDAEEAQAVAIENLSITWPFARLISADPLSVDVQIERIQVAPRLSEEGQWIVIEPKASETVEEPEVAEATDGPVTPPILQRFWTDPEHPLQFVCEELRIVFPENSPFAARRLTLAPSMKLSSAGDGKLALVGSLGEIHLDDPLLATGSMTGTVDLATAKAQLQLTGRLEDATPLGALLPPGQAMPATLAIDAQMDVALGWDPLEIEQCDIRVASEGGELATPDRKLPLPAWEVRVAAKAHDFTPLPNATVHLETDLWADGREIAPAKSRLDVAFMGADSLVEVHAATGGWTLGMLRHWVEGLEELDASGSFGAQLSAVYHLDEASLREARATMNVEGGQAALPGVLKQAITIAPTHIVAEIGKDLETGQILPFALVAGPAQFKCDGLNWSFREGHIGGEGSFTLLLPGGPDIPDWIEADTLSQLPATAEEFREIAFAPIQIDITVVGSSPEAIELNCTTATRLLLNDGHLDLNTATQVDTAKGIWKTTVDLPTFDPGSWHMRLFKRLPVPDLALPMSLRLSADGTLDGELNEAAWEYRAGPGIILPNGPLAQWLQAEVPVDQFILGGRLREKGRIAELDTCDFRSGRARMRFTRAQVDIPQSVLTGMPTEATVHFGLLLENWHPIDFLPLLAGELRKQIPLSAEEVEELGLARLELTAETKLALDDDGAWVPRSLQASVDTDFVGGQTDIPIATQISFDPDTGIVTATATSAKISPEIWKLKPLALIPVELSGTAVPFEFEVRLSAGLPGLADDETPKVGFVLKAGPGPLNAPEFLQAPVGLDRLTLDLQVRLDSLELEEASVLIDLDGPTIRLERLRAIPNEALTTWKTAAELTVEDLSLDWALSKVSPSVWQESVPPAFLPSQVQGAVGLNLTVATLVDTEKLDGIPEFDQLAYAVEVSDVRVDWEDRPHLALTHLSMKGGADVCRVNIRDLGSGGWVAQSIEALIQNPLAEIPAAQVDVQIAGDLEALPGLFDAWAGPLELGENPIPAGLDGTVNISVGAHAPVNPEVDLKTITATVRAQVTGVPLAPLIPDGPSAGIADFSGTVSLEKGQGQVTGEAQLTGLDWAPFLKGDATIALHGESDTVTAAGGIEADLTQLQLSAPDELWKKPRGQAASFAAGGSLPDGWPEAGPRKALWNVGAKGFVFEQLAGHGSITLDPVEGAPYGGLQVARMDDFEFDAGKFSGTVTIAPELIDLAVAIERFDLPILMRRTAAIARPLQVPVEESETDSVLPPPTATDPDATESLPPIHIALTGRNFHLGEGHAITDLSVDARLIDGLPHTASVRFDVDGTPLDISLGAPNTEQQQAWSLDIADLGRLFDSLTAPSRAAPVFFPPESPLPPLNAHVGTIVGGRLHTMGWVNLRGEAPILDATLKLEGIAFHKEIPLLSKFAALAKREFILKVPCHVFEWTNLHFENQQFSARDGFIDGPINLSFESVLADLDKETLNAKGKVFALCYELDGPLTAPSPYLCEDSAVIRALTSEDEFVW